MKTLTIDCSTGKEHAREMTATEEQAWSAAQQETATQEAAAAGRIIPRREWMNRLPRTTQRAIRKSLDDDIQDGVEEMRMATVIDLDDPLVGHYVNLLRTKGLITEAEKSALLAPKA